MTKQLTYDKASPLIFSSGLFMAMFVVFTLFYYMLSGKTTAKLMFVTLFSYYFYYKSSGLHFVLLAAVTTTDYLIARWMARATKGRGALLSLSILTDLGLLFYFKYTNFFGSIFAGLSGCQFTPLDIVLPVGISFFTFQSMSYTIDVYRRRLKPVGSWLDYAFYVSFFPQLVAGPIVRARDFIPQIRRCGGVSETMMARGVMMIAMGLAKKAIISDYISLNFVDRVFENPQLYTGFENLLGIYGYTLQIYCDFSGYSDMAIGIALLLGFHFPDNFNAPFKSASVTEFWRRWHISLSSWIRDYVYIAFGGNRHGSVRTYTNLLSSMLLCGLWHGASWNFVVWGGVHGVLLAFHKFFSQTVLGRSRHYRSRGIRRVAGVVLTFHAVALLFMVFRMPDLGSCMTMLSQIVGSFHAEMASEVMKSYWIVMALMAFGYASHYISNRFLSRCVLALKSGGLLLQVFVLVVVAYIIVQVKSSEIQPFIYFQF
ncbi:MAG: MBOAT family O-acyltransferase [Prevotella sp.]|nr:MBOAT family O-acyltransferase [Prevotella sp.]